MKLKFSAELLIVLFLFLGINNAKAAEYAGCTVGVGRPCDCSVTQSGYECIDFNNTNNADRSQYLVVPYHCGTNLNIVCAKEKAPIVAPVTPAATYNPSASGLLPKPSAPVKDPSACIGTNNCGNYAVNDFLELGKNLMQFMLGTVGSLALLAFVWGGFQWLISGGDAGKVKKGRDAIMAAVVGLIIVFTSYILVKYLLETMGYNWTGSSQYIEANK